MRHNVTLYVGCLLLSLNVCHVLQTEKPDILNTTVCTLLLIYRFKHNSVFLNDFPKT